MYGAYFNQGFSMIPGAFGVFMLPVLLWSFAWKGLALWHAATRKQGWWFIALLIINTVGILEIVYLFGVLKVKPEDLVPKR